MRDACQALNDDSGMLQPGRDMPVVERVPAPWSLDGDAWMVLVRWPRAQTAQSRAAFVPRSLRSTLGAPLGVLLCVDYRHAPCGPYREILLIPGSFVFDDGRRHFSISRILVSTWESVVNGRANWGIPKDRADFDVVDRGDTERIVVSDAQREICALEFERPRGPRMPASTAWMPQRPLTLAQRYAGRTYYYTPAARGSVRRSRLVDWRFDAALFPDLRETRVLVSLRIERFQMTFPVAHTR